MNLVAIATRCAAECERQKVGLRELGYLLDGYLWLIEYDGFVNFNKDVFETLGSFVEPGKNRNGFRKVPVTFGNGGSSANASDIPRLMINLRDAIADFRKIPPMGPTVETANALTKEFLWIHPFVDGNGRVAFMLYNYLMGSLDNPRPLPYYFGEK